LFFFTFFNWFLEIAKWKTIIKKIKYISWNQSFVQSLSSSALAMITPVRTGEYGMKVLYFEKHIRKDVALHAFIGNLYQLIASILFGLLGIIFLSEYINEIFRFRLFSFLFIFIISFITTYFIKEKVPVFKHWYLKFLEGFHFGEKNYRNALLLSFLRYIVFSHQFYFLILIFNIDITYLEAISCIASMYLLTSIVPILPLFDFALKGSVAILIFDIFEVNPLHIVTITSLMWILNFAIPAIIGSYFVLKFKPQQV